MKIELHEEISNQMQQNKLENLMVSVDTIFRINETSTRGRFP